LLQKANIKTFFQLLINHEYQIEFLIQGYSVIRLVSFAVDTNFQKQGIGSLLLKQVTDDYQHRGYGAFNLTARASAHGFYLKNGFQDISGPFKNRHLGVTDYDMQRVIECKASITFKSKY